MRARLRGPSMLAYYPQSFDIAQIARRYPELEIVNEREIERLQDVLDRKRRGKGPPKKAKSKGSYTSSLFLLHALIPAYRGKQTLGQKALKTFCLALLAIYSFIWGH